MPEERDTNLNQIGPTLYGIFILCHLNYINSSAGTWPVANYQFILGWWQTLGFDYSARSVLFIHNFGSDSSEIKVVTCYISARFIELSRSFPSAPTAPPPPHTHTHTYVMLAPVTGARANT